MKYIAHRGNIDGSAPELENNPEHILRALNKGFDVEVDIWYALPFKGSISPLSNLYLYLGHDEPKTLVPRWMLLPQLNRNIWWHCKNLNALKLCLEEKRNCFFHNQDAFTLTSNGYIWTYPGQEVTDRSIVVCNDENCPDDRVYGVCSDYVEKIKDEADLLKGFL